MLVLNPGDKIEAHASVGGVVHYTLNGLVGGELSQLAVGKLSNTSTPIFIALDKTIVKTVTIVNKDAQAHTMDLDLLPNGEVEAICLTAENVALQPGYAFYTDFEKVAVLDPIGAVVTTAIASVHTLASHVDVDATGAQLNALVGGGETNLHTHPNMITQAEKDAITANSAKVGITIEQAAAIVANTAKVGITTQQAQDIVANNAKVGITPQQTLDIIANNAKVGITVDQANAIVANTAKVGLSAGDQTKLTYIDQDVKSGTSPTFDGQNFTNIAVVKTSLDVRKGSIGTIAKMQPVYLSGYNVGGWAEVEGADAANDSTLPCIGLTAASTTNSATTKIVTGGELTGVDTSAFSVGDNLFVAQGGGLTSTHPVGTNKVQKVAQVIRSHGSLGVVIVFGAGRVNDVPNIPEGNIWKGAANGHAEPFDFDDYDTTKAAEFEAAKTAQTYRADSTATPVLLATDAGKTLEFSGLVDQSVALVLATFTDGDYFNWSHTGTGLLSFTCATTLVSLENLVTSAGTGAGGTVHLRNGIFYLTGGLA